MKNIFKDIKCIVCSLAAIVWMSACTVEVPSHVIQPEEMEDLLYDYHLMQAMAGDLTSTESYKRKQYEQYVFDKYHVTEAKFDTSLTWYMRHTKELEAIYKNLNTRFSNKKEELAAHIPAYERIEQMSAEGDTVDVWNDFRLIRLTTSPISNKMVFQLNPDSNYHQRDSFVWKLNAHFLGDTAASRAVMGITLVYDKDTIGQSHIINHSGEYSLSLTCDSTFQLKNIYGQVYYYEKNKGEYEHLTIHSESLPEFRVLPVPDLLLSDIAIIRYHRTDTVSTDTTSIANKNLEQKDFQIVKQ